MATSKTMAKRGLAPAVLACLGAQDIVHDALAAAGTKKKARSNGKDVSAPVVNNIIQCHQCDWSLAESDPKIVLL